jgi:acetate kinase
MARGDVRARLAFDTFVYSAKRYIGEYLAILNGADCIVFTAGAGQNGVMLRSRIVSDMENLGVVLDEPLNKQNPREGLISAASSKVKIAVIPTNEEYVVAREVSSFLISR